jgi:sulfite reductase (ferredoxin)
LADLTNLQTEEFVDWGHVEQFVTAIGVGECAGVVIDLVATLLLEADEKFEWARQNLEKGAYADAIYHTYATFVSAAKSLLLDKGVNSSTQVGVIREFDNHYVESGEFKLSTNFSDLVLQINKNEPTAEFAQSYFDQAAEFLNQIKVKRNEKVTELSK